MLRTDPNKKERTPKKTLKKGVRAAVKNKGSQKHKRGPKRSKYQRPWSEHPETVSFIDKKDIHANHLEATNASVRRSNSAYRRKTNTYAKGKPFLQRTLDMMWIIRNFVRQHFTTRKVPAVAQGICLQGFSLQELMLIRFHQ